MRLMRTTMIQIQKLLNKIRKKSLRIHARNVESHSSLKEDVIYVKAVDGVSAIK